MRAALCALLLVTAGCSSSSSRPHIQDVAPVGSIQVAFVEPDEFDQDDRAEVVEAVERHLAAWSSDFNGRRMRPTVVDVLNVDEFPCGGVMAIGCTRADGHVLVVRGEKNSLPGLYHEFCHRGPANDFYGADPQHLSPAWTSWTERSFQVANDLIRERSLW